MSQLAIDFYKSYTKKVPISLQEIVLRIIQEHEGRENAISVSEIQRTMGEIGHGDWPGVKIRQVVRDLRIKHGFPIGSATDKPAGYFIAVTKEEINKVCDKLDHRAMMIFFMSSRLRKIGFREYYGQLALKLDEFIESIGP